MFKNKIATSAVYGDNMSVFGVPACLCCHLVAKKCVRAGLNKSEFNLFVNENQLKCYVTQTPTSNNYDLTTHQHYGSDTSWSTALANLDKLSATTCPVSASILAIGK